MKQTNQIFSILFLLAGFVFGQGADGSLKKTTAKPSTKKSSDAPPKKKQSAVPAKKTPAPTTNSAKKKAFA